MEEAFPGSLELSGTAVEAGAGASVVFGPAGVVSSCAVASVVDNSVVDVSFSSALASTGWLGGFSALWAFSATESGAAGGGDAVDEGTAAGEGGAVDDGDAVEEGSSSTSRAAAAGAAVVESEILLSSVELILGSSDAGAEVVTGVSAGEPVDEISTGTAVGELSTGAAVGELSTGAVVDEFSTVGAASAGFSACGFSAGGFSGFCGMTSARFFNPADTSSELTELAVVPSM